MSKQIFTKKLSLHDKMHFHDKYAFSGGGGQNSCISILGCLQVILQKQSRRPIYENMFTFH